MNNSHLMLLKILNKLIHKQEMNMNDYLNDEIYKKALNQGFGGIIYLDSDEDNSKKKSSNRIIINTMRILQTGWVLDELKKQAIEPIILKGLSIARFYENPSSRSMGDLDILVRPSEFENAINIMNYIGYKEGSEDYKHPIHIEFFKQNVILVELHKALINIELMGNRHEENWYTEIWSRKKLVSVDGVQFYAMSEEDELVNQIIHFATHFVWFGTKLKHIYEMALIIHSTNGNLDWGYIKKILDMTGFTKFAKLIFSVINTFFEVEVPEEYKQIDIKIQHEFMDDLLNIYSLQKEFIDIRGLLKHEKYFHVLFKHKIFKPFVWGIEYLYLWKHNERKNFRIFSKKCKNAREYGLISFER